MKKILTVAALGLIALPSAASAQSTEAAKPTLTEAAPSSTQAPKPALTEAATTATEAPQKALQFVTTQEPGSLFSSDLVGYSVYGSGEEKIGDINDILIDGNGMVHAVVIGIGGFGGIGEMDVAVTLESLDVEFVEDRYTISIDTTEEALADAPTFKRADGTTSDRVGAFERSFARARVDAGKAFEAVSERADELYQQVSGAAEEATDDVKEAIQ